MFGLTDAPGLSAFHVVKIDLPDVKPELRDEKSK
jgi:hypothetical protein